ncbi:hypothetical protein ACN4Z0_16670, partial [Legionella sp. 28fTON52]
SSAVLGVGGGYRFTHFIVPAVSVGINYSHFFNRTINGQIRQYRFTVVARMINTDANTTLNKWRDMMDFQEINF